MFPPVPEAQRKVPFPHISRWIHAGEETEVWVSYQGLCIQKNKTIRKIPEILDNQSQKLDKLR